MATWFCYGCDENIGDKEYCPYCGMHRSGDKPMSKQEATTVLAKFFGKKPKAEKQAMFSEEECLVYSIHPNDEMYRKIMELNVLSKNYK